MTQNLTAMQLEAEQLRAEMDSLNKLADSFGIAGVRAKSPEELRPVLEKAIDATETSAHILEGIVIKNS